MPDDDARPGRPAVDTLAFLRELGGAAGRGDGFDAALVGIVAAIAATGWDVVLVWTLDGDHQHLRLHPTRAGDPEAGAELARACADRTVAPGQGLVGRAWLGQELVVRSAEPSEDDGAGVARADALGLSEVAAVALADGPSLAAVVEVYGTGEGTGAERRARHEALVAAAALCGPALVSRSARAAAGAADARFRALVDTAVDAIVLADAGGRIVGWNPAARAMFGWQEHEALGQPLTILMPERFRAAHQTGLARLLAGGERRLGDVVEVVGLRRDGRELPIELALSTWTGDDGASIAGIIRDVSERHAALAAVRAAQAQAERASAARSELLSRVSHELRTPLNAILGFAQLLELDPVDPEHDDAVRHVLSAGRHLLALVDEVLDLGMIDAGDIELVLEPVELGALVAEAVTGVAPLAADRGIAVTVGDGVPPGAQVHADARRLGQVLHHLLTNAVRYNRPGGTVEVAWAAAAGTVRVTVTDTGAGIAPDVIDRAFEPFARADDGDGAGLGLTLVRRLVEAMGGTAGATSEPGLGSTFWVALAEASTGAGAPEAGPARVLYVEDNAANVKLVARILERAGDVDLVTVLTGGEALAAALAHRPHLVLLDLHLPDMPGEEVLAGLAAHPDTAAVPVVVVSADARPDRIAHLRELGVVDYVTKPFDVATFTSAVRANLRR